MSKWFKRIKHSINSSLAQGGSMARHVQLYQEIKTDLEKIVAVSKCHCIGAYSIVGMTSSPYKCAKCRLIELGVE